MAAPRNRLFELLDQPSTADVLARTEVDRGDIYPIVQYGDGRFEFGVPGYARAAGNAVNSILQALYEDPLSIVRQPVESGAELLWGGAKEAAMSGDPEAIRRASGQAMDFASLIPMGSVAAHAAGGVPQNSLGIFGGRMAKTADHDALARAEQMAAQGVPREQIWSDTGWFQGVDGKWRFEIDDSGANWTQPGNTFGEIRDGLGWGDHRIRHAFDHKSFDAAYPLQMNVGIEKAPPSSAFIGRAGSGDLEIRSDWPRNDARSTVLHELQHYVQDSEGFAAGGDGGTGYAKRVADELSGQMQEQLGRLLAGGVHINEAMQIVKPLRTQSLSLRKTGDYDAYNATAGEVEARAVQARRDLTPEQRRARAPWLDYDVPEDQQIVRSR